MTGVRITNGLAVRPVKAVLWDIDGTLVDSEPLHLNAMMTACANRGAPITEADYYGLLGQTNKACWAWLRDHRGYPGTYDEFDSDADEVYFATIDGLKLRTEALIPTIAAISAMGVPSVAVTNARRHVAEANLKALRLDQYLKGLVSVDDVAEGKPHPEGYLQGAAMLNVNPANALVLEDSETGANAGLAAGGQVILWAHDGVNDETHPAGLPTSLVDLIRTSHGIDEA